jgi:hypothetical protein
MTSNIGREIAMYTPRTKGTSFGLTLAGLMLSLVGRRSRPNVGLPGLGSLSMGHQAA